MGIIIPVKHVAKTPVSALRIMGENPSRRITTRHVLLDDVSRVGMDITVYKREQKMADSEDPMYWNGIYTGIKYQCVELARRYYLIKYGLLFNEVRGAKDILSLNTIFNMESKRYILWPTYLNKGIPPIGSLLIWKPSQLYPASGHVAIVIASNRQYVDIIEQNYGLGQRRIPIENGQLKSEGLLGLKLPPYSL
jgi:CHAP domain